jgi:signal transduction histidine kinase
MAAKLTIMQKGLILIAVPLLFQAAFIALVAVVRHQGREAERLTIHTKEVITQIPFPRLRLVAAQNASRGFVITGDPAFAEEQDRSSDQARRELAKLKGLVADNPKQVERVEAIAAKAERFLASLRETEQAVRAAEAVAAVATVKGRAEDVLLGELRGEFDAFLAEEESLDAERRERLNRLWRRFDGLIYGGTAASVVGSLLLATAYGGGISGRIRALADNARRLAEGRELAPPIGGGDEVARLDADFRHMAATLREATALLERRAEELDAANVQLRERNQENEMFVYSVSHDIRSPLVNLQGFSKELGHIGKDLRALLADGELGEDGRRRALALVDREMDESIHYIQTAVSRLAAIVDALLRLSRAGRVEYRQQPVDLAATVSRIVEALRGTIEERGATVRVGRLPAAWGDPTALEQVFANLLSNALNYLDPARPGIVEVGCLATGDADDEGDGAEAGPTTYFVRDNGLGIPEAYHAKVFGVFQRLHGEVAQGEGVGLALTRRAVERHGGRIWFESAPGRGTTFFVALPGPPEMPETADGPETDHESLREPEAITGGMTR